MISQQEKELKGQVRQVRERLEALSGELAGVEAEADRMGPQRAQHDLLEQACVSLRKLDELGSASLFWGDRGDAAATGRILQEAARRLDDFKGKVAEIEERRLETLDKIRREEEILEILGEDLYELRQAEERRKLEWVVERDISPSSHRVLRMAWARGGEDDRRFRKSLGISVLASLLLVLLLNMIDLPIPPRFEPEAMPRRLAQLVRKVKAKPILPEPPVPEQPQEEPEKEEPKAPEEQERKEPEPTEVADAQENPDVTEPAPGGPTEEPPAAEASMAAAGPVTRKQVKKAGILAFKEEFASLAKDEVAQRLGADARYGDADDVSRSQDSSRSMLTTNAPGSSGGINIASLSRSVGGGGGGNGGGGGGGGGGIHGVPLGKATSSIASIGPGGRPVARGGPGAARTDEEIQIVFDRYKARFYRLYNRELRKDPTLQGQMILRLTIEPDGSVSMCKLQSTDMHAPDLADQIVDVVLTIDFGPKEGVQAMTIVYPIDFLPAST